MNTSPVRPAQPTSRQLARGVFQGGRRQSLAEWRSIKWAKDWAAYYELVSNTELILINPNVDLILGLLLKIGTQNRNLIKK